MSEPQRLCHTLSDQSGRVRVPLVVKDRRIGVANEVFILHSPSGAEVARIPGHLLEPLACVLGQMVEIRRAEILADGYAAAAATAAAPADDRLHLRCALTVMMPDPSDRNTWRWSLVGRSHAPVSSCAAETRADFPVDSVCRTAHLAISVPMVFAKAISGDIEGMIEA